MQVNTNRRLSFLLTERQLRRVESLPVGHTVLNTRYGALIVRGPRGQLSRVKPNGRLVQITPVERVQSYLQLGG